MRSPSSLSREVLAGIVTTLALIPEVISFSVIAGVDPKVSLIASVVLAISMSFLGGRPAMVTAAAGAVALVVAPLVREHGVEYILPVVLLAGTIQILFGLAGLHRVMNFVPRSVMTGFVNALGILIFGAQVRHLFGGTAEVYALFVLTVSIVLLAPRLTKSVPAPLIAIAAVTAVAVVFGIDAPSVRGDGQMQPGLPGITPFLVPFDVQTLQIVWSTALSVAFVGLLETLLTAKLVDEMTETGSDKRRESWALGIGNILAGFYGGIAGCAMIGQTVVNVKFGRARTRISTLTAGVVLLILVTALNEVLARIPMIALAAVMMVVALRTIDWNSLRPASLRRSPVTETLIMAVTVAFVVATDNLAIGVGAGVVLAMIFLAFQLAGRTHVERILSEDGSHVRYRVRGPLFFGSSSELASRFSPASDPESIIIDFEQSQICDASSMTVLDAIHAKYRARGANVTFVGLDDHSLVLRARLSGHG